MDKYIYPAQNAFTTSGDGKTGRPTVDNPDAEGTAKTKNSGGNNNPSPSD